MNNTKEFVKPECKLVGADGNVFMLMGLASRALKKAGFPEKAVEMLRKVSQQKSYDSALGVICEYVDAY